MLIKQGLNVMGSKFAQKFSLPVSSTLKGIHLGYNGVVGTESSPQLSVLSNGTLTSVN